MARDGDNVTSGICSINVPMDHDIGNINYNQNGDKNISFKFTNHDKFSNDNLFEKVKKDPFDEVLVFVHGFNVNFEEAALRAAQIKYDMKFPGKVILFTWPAGSDKNTLLGKLMMNLVYANNYKYAVRTRPLFIEFMKNLKKTGKKVHLMVHSMGHQIVLPSLAQMKEEGKFISELVLNAPDFSTTQFNGIQDSLKKVAGRITLYCSPRDNALLASSTINENDRLGSCSNFPGIDVVNVQYIDEPLLGVGLGHGYYSSRPILTDIYQLILGVEAKKRLFIRKSQNTAKEDYILRK